MAVKIRLKRLGKIRVPQYRIVVVDARKKRDGKVIEEIGKYHPKEDPSLIDVTSDRAQYWLGVGAQPTEAVQALFRVTGDWQKFKGLPGSEGRLKVATPKRDKLEIFNEALKEVGGDGREAVTRKTASARRTTSTDDAPAPVPADESLAGATAVAEAAERAEVDTEQRAAKDESADNAPGSSQGQAG